MALPKTIILLLSVLLYSVVPFQQACAQEAGEQAPGAMEEVTVIGEKTLLELEREYILAEDNFFEMFNEFNDDWRYEVVCKKETPTGSHIKRRVCRSRHQMELWSEAGKAELLRGHADPGAWAATNMYDKGMKDKIAEVAKANPRLLERLIEYRDKFQLFKTESERQCDSLLLVCKPAED
jgi:hypothetical protein